ncbi:hypothetical protein [Sediminibacillus halophilus]|uniref:Uncharacterized protein n=1 Tax=Sediminibacillus halophilus TaxID=482461 RepID=A0A1G9RWS5_9BACI|nr:hypothetical protein [Sediminibacillus halophilus]SDM27673.1 hypothetical protein SAMN05216244_2179 [Sediminibacillus halophilus]
MEPDGYSLLEAKLIYDDDKQYYKISLGYGSEKGKKEKDEEGKDKKEQVNFIFGPYKGRKGFRATIEPRKEDFDLEEYAANMANDRIELTEVKGHKLAITEIEMATRQFWVTILFEDIVYKLVIPLEQEGKGLSKEAAFKYIENVIQANEA